MEENNCEDIRKQIIGNNLEHEDAQFINEGHALMNALVLDNIIRFSRYNDIRNCRLVCQRWNEISETVFWKLSRIKIVSSIDAEVTPRYLDLDKVQSVEEKSNKIIRNFDRTFPGHGMPLNEIVFDGYMKRDVVDYFWKERGSLTLTNIYFRYFTELSSKPMDLNYFLTSNVMTLHISSAFRTKFVVSLELLKNIHNLHLEDCRILLKGKIAPRQLYLDNSNSVSYNGVEFELGKFCPPGQRLLINDFVDFSRTKKLYLRGSILKLDVGIDISDLEYLDLENVEIVGLSSSQWTTNRFHIKSNICAGDKMKIKSISFADYDNIDCATFPASVEKLLICYKYMPLTPQMLVYPQLKRLSLVTVIRYNLPIFDFRSCTSLVDFNLRIDGGIYKMDFNRILLPSSIKRVKLHNVDVTTDAPWKLDTLILYNYSFSCAKDIFSRVNTAKLVLYFSTVLEYEKDKISILNHWEKSKIKLLALGEMRWSSKNSFLNSEFSRRVKKLDRCYVFTKKTNGKGKAIDFLQFLRFCHLKTPENDVMSKF